MDSLNLDRHWRRIMDTLRDGVMVINREGKVVMVNRAICRQTGYEPEELVGRPCTVFNCDTCARVRRGRGDHWCELFAGGQPEDTDTDCHLIRKDGSCLPALKTARLLRDPEGGVLGVVETVTDLTELVGRDRRISELTRRLAGEAGFMGMVGESPAMLEVHDLLARAARGDAPVLIHGESGTGKEMAARAVHELGPRNESPYVVVNCAALSESLLESELFGHVKGAFTGAHRHRVGRLEEAHGGDIFLDEIGELPLGGQVKLLRVLEQKSFERVGDQRPIRVDVRFISATNRDLSQMMRQGLFRQDLFFRLNVVPIHLPPLRHRREDIPALTEHFLERLKRATGKKLTGVSPGVMERFMDHAWPGNVRELRTALEYAFVLADEGRIHGHHLPPGLRKGQAEQPSIPYSTPFPSQTIEVEVKGDVSQHQEPRPEKPGEAQLRRELAEALKASRGNISQAARLLGVSRATAWNRMHRLGVQLKRVVEERD